MMNLYYHPLLGSSFIEDGKLPETTRSIREDNSRVSTVLKCYGTRHNRNTNKRNRNSLPEFKVKHSKKS
jgi:hypothetical protein